VAVSFWELRLFKEIAVTGSMSKGAKLCGVTQSAASQHVQEVERRLGVPLLDRSKRPLETTPAGKLYADFCRAVLQQEDEFQLALERLKLEVDGTVRVASIYSVGLSEMSRLSEEFAASHPTARLEVEYMRPDKIYAALRSGQADLGLVSYPESSREIAAIPWRDEEMQLAAPPSHPLAARQRVFAADLEAIEFIGFDEDLSIRREIDRFLRARGVTVRMVMHFDNIQMIKEAVALGSGVSILPARSMQAEIEQGRLVAVALEAPGLVRPVGIVHRRRKKFNRAAQAFLELLLPGGAEKITLAG
jgi:LysR family transcriptional regulator, transcriptional activator of the cysJI operon